VDGVWATKSKGVGLIDRQLVSKISNLCDPDPPTLQTDGQTDRRTTCNLYTALCTSASRGKNNIKQRGQSVWFSGGKYRISYKRI